MENQQTNSVLSIWEKNKLMLKGFLIGFLIIIMLIPASMLTGLVQERQQRQEEVMQEVSSKWASPQTIAGPMLLVPYLVRPDSSKPAIRSSLYILPELLTINGRLLPEVRHRSLYDVTLYRSDLMLSGTFDPASVSKLGIPPENILWNESQLILGLNDMRGLEDNVTMQWDSSKTLLEAGLPDNRVIKQGLSAKLAIDPSRPLHFSTGLKIKGSFNLYFAPVGKTTEVTLSSPWKDPAFDGQYLPSEPAKITDSGFTARWKVLQVSRNYPQVWKDGAQVDVESSAFGVKLLQPTDSYAKTQRSLKYSILIIALSFTVFFFMEIFQKRQIHPLQYVLVGIALCIFYSLLLAISEYVGFNPAYLIAAAATVGLIGMYVRGIFKKVRTALGFSLALAGLYTYIFILIQLQDYALLFGSIGLFLMLAVIMHFSRKIDWHAATSKTI